MPFNLSRQKPFGLDISNDSVKCVVLGGSLSSPKLLAMGDALLEPEVFTGLRIADRKKLKKSIIKLIKNPQFGKLKTEKFIFSLPESKSFTHVFEVSEELKEKEILDFVKSQAIENFPYPLKDLCFDYNLRERRVLLVAAQKNVINDYLSLFKDCGIQPIAFETESISLGRALIEKDSKPTLIVDIGAEVTNLTVFDVSCLMLSDSLEVGGERFSQALIEKLSVSKEESERLKRKVGIDPGFKKGRAFLILQKEIRPIIEEIKRLSAYFKEKTGRDFEKLILAGGSSAMPYLSEYLKENVDISLEICDPWVKINIDLLKKKEYFKKALEVNPNLYSIAIGSALRGLIKNPARADINLMPKKVDNHS